MITTMLRKVYSIPFQQLRWKSSGVRIGCASGFWGDTPTSSAQLVKKGNINYLVSDYLSEITMSLLTAAKRKNPEMGYAPDFVHFAVGPLLKEIKKKGIKVISNAGGTNPIACAEALSAMSAKMGVDMKIAVVTGDDMMPKAKELKKDDTVKEMFSGQELPPALMSMNAYYGAGPIKDALSAGADIVVTGRCVDSALVLAPLMHEFNWSYEDYDKLAAGSLAGHLLECGCQSTGGIFTDWQMVPDWDTMGFPIAECHADGRFVVTKPPGTGGLVSKWTVAEQLVYEIDDPQRYVLPDVVCDWSQVSMVEVGPDQVEVSNASGHAPTEHFKVCATHLDGFRCTAVFLVNGKNAVAKGHRTADSIVKRVRALLASYGMSDFRRVNVHAIGDEQMYGEQARVHGDLRETMVWMAMEHDDKKALQLFTREIAAAGTGMAPGLCAFVGGRPKVSPVLKLFSFLHPKRELQAEVRFISDEGPTLAHQHHLPPANQQAPQRHEADGNGDAEVERGTEQLILEDLAYARSGDKGDSCNVGVIARHPDFVPYIRAQLTSDAVHRYFRHLCAGDADSVTRYDLPGVDGLNFVLRESLGGGGVASLRIDPQGKGFGQMLLDFELRNLPDKIVKLAAELKQKRR